MKIDQALMSCDDNSMYLDFWPIVSQAWKEILDIEPILFYVGNEDQELDTSYGKVCRIACSPEYPSTMHALNVRYWATQLTPTKTSILTDMDMLPISKWYFIEQLESIPEAWYVHINPSDHRLPTCYHIARGDVFKEVLELDDNYDDYVRKVSEFEKTGGDFEGWASDEVWASMKVHNRIRSGRGGITMLLREPGRCIDRSHWEWYYEWIRDGRSVDSHMPRPYTEYQEQVDRLVEQVFQYAPRVWGEI